jgi:5'-3' exonuclease
MGIPKFYGEFIRNKTTSIKERYDGKVGSLSIDLNGIIHGAAQQIFAYGSYNNLELRKQHQLKDLNIMYNDVYHKVALEIKRLYDKYHPDVLVVAVDGVAPLAKIDQQRSRRYINAEEPIELLRFDSAAISPGTDFMIGLDKFLREWFARERNNLCYKVVYSSHLIPGEGEHKILDLMRDSDLYEKSDVIHLFHGADADLYMLSLVSPLNNIWIVREDVRGTNYIDIENLKRDIKKAMQSETATYDFVVLAFLLGNDFVPHIFSLNEVIATLDHVMLLYRQNATPLVVDGRINFDAVKRIMSSLAFNELNSINRIAETSIKFPHPALEAARTVDGIDFKAFKRNWYQYHLNPKRESKLIGPIDPNDPARNDIIKDATNAYYMTLEWVWLYYFKGIGAINLDWYYPYNFAPLLIDMIEPVIGTEHLVESDPVHKFYHPLQQMFMIFSPKSNSLIPFNLGTLMTDNKLIDLYPTKCIITHDGYNTDWQKDIILPALDPQRIADVIIPEAIPNLNQKFPYENELFIDVRENLKRKKQVYVKPRETTPRLGTASTLSSSTSSGLKRPLVSRRP